MAVDLTLVQVVELYESEDRTPAEIAALLYLDESIVVACLSAKSAMYKARHELEDKPEDDVSDAVFAQIREAVIDTALSSDNEKLRAKMQLFLWNEKKGRNDKRELPNVNVNISMINERFLEMKQARLAVVRQIGNCPPEGAQRPNGGTSYSQQQVVDVESSLQTA